MPHGLLPAAPRRHLFDRPVGILAVLAALLVLGGAALPGLRINLVPPGFQAPMAFVTMSMDTESSIEALEAVTRPAEEILRSLNGADWVRTDTKGGRVSIAIGAAHGVTANDLAGRVSEALDANRQRFPPTMRRPSVGTWSLDESVPLIELAFDSGALDEGAFRDLVERKLMPAAMRVPGVAKVGHSLEGEGMLMVGFDPHLSTAARVDLRTVIAHLGAAPPRSHTLPVRDQDRRREQVLRVRSADLDQAGLPDLPLGGGARLSDVAEVESLPADYGHWVVVNGRFGAIMHVFQSPDASSFTTSAAVARALQDEANRAGVAMTVQRATHLEIASAFNELAGAACIGVAVSVTFLVLFLRRYRLALLVCAALPLSMAMAVLAMAATDRSLNLLSLIGFLLASGMVIDNAIVVGEALLRARDGADPAERARIQRRAVASVAMAIVVSTVTTLALFVPMIVTGDTGGMRPLLVGVGKPIGWSLFGSLIIALVLVPMAFPRLYPRGMSAGGRHRGHAAWLIRAERRYGRVLGWLLLRPALGLLLVAVVTAGCATLLWFKPPLGSDNGEDDRRIELSANARGNPHAKDIAAAFQRWQDELGPQRARLGITSIVSDFTLDHGSLRIYLTPLDPQGRTLAKLREEIIGLLTPQLAVTLDDHLNRARGEAVEAVETDPKQSADDRKKADEKRADGKRKRDAAKKNAHGSQVGGGFGGGWASANQVTLRMLAPDEATIDEAWTRLRGLLLTTPGVQWPGSPLPEPPHDLELALTPVAEERGWRADQLATQVTRYAGTRQVLSLPDGRTLRVGPLEDQPRTLARLLGVEVMKDAGPELLDNLVTRDETPTQVQIKRRDGLSQREFTINVEPTAKSGLIARLPELAKAADLPAGVQVQLGWRETRSQQGNDQMLLSIVLAFLVIYLIMGILYESVLAPLAVMVTVLLAMVTVWALLGYVHLSLDLMVFLGLFMLVGIVVNHGVVLIDRIDAAVPMGRLAEAHLRRRAPLAVAAAARRRMAPVLLTSLTTIAGAIPMAFSNGRIDGTPISGLGLSLTIGLSAATVFTLVVMPVVYQWFALLRAGALRLLRTW